MKKILTLILFSMIAFNTVHAEITWNLSDDGTLTISGKDMPDYDRGDNKAPWSSQQGKIKEIVIENGVTNIGKYAFLNCRSLTSVTIPNSVTKIGSYAFYNCSTLTSITIPKSVTSIGTMAFRGCSALISITIPEFITSVGGGAFMDCYILKEKFVNLSKCDCDYNEIDVEQEDGLLIKGKEVVRCRPWAVSVIIPNSVTRIGSSAFDGCKGLTSITILSSAIYIGSSTFSGCPITSVTLGMKNVISIPLNRSGLTSITLLDGVKSIDNNAFHDCSSLTSVTIPNTVTSIGQSAFAGCSGLTSVTIGNSVTTIGQEAFAGCSGLTSITIPNSVTNIGQEAFAGCSGLTSITIPNSVTDIGQSAFSGCSGLISVTIPSSVTNIGDNVFSDCLSLTSATIGMKNIETTFNGCQTLTSITLLDGVTNIGEGAFQNCSNLISITIPNSVTSIEANAFEGTKWYAYQPDGLIYAGLVLYKYKGTMPANTNIAVKEKTNGIADNAFSGNSSLTSITIPNSVTSIGSGAFSGCSGLTNVSIPETVSIVGYGAFYNCSGLTFIISKPSTPPNCGNYCFGNIDKSIPVYVPVKCVETYKSANEWKDFPNIQALIEPANISFANANEILIVGKTKKIDATITPEDVINKTITWTSSNTAVATVSSKGIVTAKNIGTTIITAKTYNGKTAKCTVTVEQPITAITLSDATASLWVGNTKALTATITPTTVSNTAVNWSSSDKNVAIVSSEGMITAKGIGTCTITCMAADGYGAKKTCEVTVKQQVTEIALSETTTSLWVGKTKTLTATISPTTANNTTVNWSSSNNNVATVSSKGVITAKGKGTCTITCTAADGYGTKSTCKVTVKQQVNSIDFGYETLTIACGEEKALTPTINPSNADVKTLTWKSTDKSVATITSEGVLTAVSPGTATITCTATDDFKKSSSITVTVEPLDITITDKNPTIKEGTYIEGGISYTRTLTKNKYTTFCMPYDVNLCDYTDYFSNVYVPMEMAFVKSGGKLTIMFKSVSLTETIRAGQPFIALASKSGTVAIKNGSKITITSLDEPQPTKLEVYNYGGNLLARNTYIDVKITGNYFFVTDLDDANNFTFSVNGQMVGATTISPYRFYITKNDDRSNAKITDILLSFDGEEATGIDEIINEQKDDDKFYNLNGQRINHSNAQKGVYIKNGKKYAK